MINNYQKKCKYKMENILIQVIIHIAFIHLVFKIILHDNFIYKCNKNDIFFINLRTMTH